MVLLLREGQWLNGPYLDFLSRELVSRELRGLSRLKGHGSQYGAIKEVPDSPQSVYDCFNDSP